MIDIAILGDIRASEKRKKSLEIPETKDRNKENVEH